MDHIERFLATVERKPVDRPATLKPIDRNNMDSYFYFNDEAKEVCFKRHDTPTPWINYLSNGTFQVTAGE